MFDLRSKLFGAILAVAAAGSLVGCECCGPKKPAPAPEFHGKSAKTVVVDTRTVQGRLGGRMPRLVAAGVQAIGVLTDQAPTLIDSKGQAIATQFVTGSERLVVAST